MRPAHLTGARPAALLCADQHTPSTQNLQLQLKPPQPDVRQPRGWRNTRNSVRRLEAGARLVGQEGHHALQLVVGQIGGTTLRRHRVLARRGRLHQTVVTQGQTRPPGSLVAELGRAGHTRAALQILLTARDSMRRDRTRSKNQLTALLRTHNLDIDARKGINKAHISLIAGWRKRPCCRP